MKRFLALYIALMMVFTAPVAVSAKTLITVRDVEIESLFKDLMDLAKGENYSLQAQFRLMIDPREYIFYTAPLVIVSHTFLQEAANPTRLFTTFVLEIHEGYLLAGREDKSQKGQVCSSTFIAFHLPDIQDCSLPPLYDPGATVSTMYGLREFGVAPFDLREALSRAALKDPFPNRRAHYASIRDKLGSYQLPESEGRLNQFADRLSMIQAKTRGATGADFDELLGDESTKAYYDVYRLRSQKNFSEALSTLEALIADNADNVYLLVIGPP